MGAVVLTATMLTGAGASTTHVKTTHVKTSAANLRSAIINGGTVTVDFAGGAWPTLDPAPATAETSEQPIFSAIYGGLFEVTPKGALAPELATGYSISKNGLIVILHLRHGVKFQDGTQFNAAAVKYNFLRDASPSVGCLCQPFLTAISSIGTPDKYTVVLHLSRKYSPILATLATSMATFIVSPTARASEGATFSTHPIGAGPFEVVSDVPNATLSLRRWRGYWDKGTPHVNQVQFVAVGTGTSAVSAVASGTAQIATGNAIGASDISTAKRQGGVRVVVQSPLNYYWITMNQNIAPFNNIAARQALYYATDSSVIAKSLLFGLGTSTQVLEGPGQAPYFGTKVAGFPSYDPTKAAALVKQIGGLTFTMQTIANSPVFVELADALQKMYAQAGITVNLDILAHPAAVNNLITGNLQAQLDIYGIYLDPDLALQTIIRCHATINKAYCNPTVDSLLGKIEGTYSATTQLRYYNQIFKIVNNIDFAAIPLTTLPSAYIETPKLHGVPNTPFLYLNDAYLTK